jgi:hypothetical protein
VDFEISWASCANASPMSFTIAAEKSPSGKVIVIARPWSSSTITTEKS